MWLFNVNNKLVTFDTKNTTNNNSKYKHFSLSVFTHTISSSTHFTCTALLRVSSVNLMVCLRWGARFRVLRNHLLILMKCTIEDGHVPKNDDWFHGQDSKQPQRDAAYRRCYWRMAQSHKCKSIYLMDCSQKKHERQKIEDRNKQIFHCYHNTEHNK